MITLLPPNHLRRQQRSDGGYDMVPAYTADEVRSHMLSWAENRVAEERERCASAVRSQMCDDGQQDNASLINALTVIRRGAPT